MATPHCVQIETEWDADTYLLCDLGVGARAFGQAQMEAVHGTGKTYYYLISHVHWDHIIGVLFFAPAYVHARHAWNCAADFEAI